MTKYNINIRFLPENTDNFKELCENITLKCEGNYTIVQNKKEHLKCSSDIDKYNFYHMEYDNTSGFYDRCWLVVVEVEDSTKEEIKKSISNLFEDKIDSIRWSKNTLSIRLIGYIPEIVDKKYIANYSKQCDKQFRINETIKFPIGILSYGRYNDNFTSKYLVKCGIRHTIFVEPCEYYLYINNYFNNLEPEKQELVEIRNVGEDFHTRNLGGTPVRNYILDYYYVKGFARCWILDDNIKCYYRYNRGCKTEIYSGSIFSSIEKYIEIYENVGVCSHNFSPFITTGRSRPVIVLNEKQYSSLLLLTDKQYRFRHKYNEDVLISVEYIISGKLNFCFNHILYNKNTSGTDKGGNTDTIYSNGYEEKYDYLYNELKKMYNSNILKIKCEFDKFISNKPLKGKDKHHNINYKGIVVDDRTTFVKKINPNYPQNELDNGLELISK